VYVQRNTVAQSRNHCWHGNATMRFLCVVDLHVAINNTIPLSVARRGNNGFPLHSCRAAGYVVLLSTIQTRLDVRVKCPILTKYGVPRQIFVKVLSTKLQEIRPAGIGLRQEEGEAGGGRDR
jgi:hypothetical protein